jgi:hypothetical protein
MNMAQCDHGYTHTDVLQELSITRSNYRWKQCSAECRIDLPSCRLDAELGGQHPFISEHLTAMFDPPRAKATRRLGGLVWVNSHQQA